mgnify:CR=1 FL=1
MNVIRFYLDISTDQIMNYYQGHAHSISVVSTAGQRIQFPANLIRQFVDYSGVSGLFEMKVEDGRCICLEKIR